MTTPNPLHRFAQLLTAATVCLIFAGGLVTSTGSGLSVPDWPLSYGQVFPKMVGGIRFEHTHRLIAGTIGILTLIFACLLARFEPRAWVRRLGWIALGAVVLQALLGGMTVIFFLPTWISVFHACLGQSFLCLCACLALVTGPGWSSAPEHPCAASPGIRRGAVLLVALIFCQLIAGALVRHADHITVRYHFFMALAVTLTLVKLIRDLVRAERAGGGPLSEHAFLLAGLTMLQVFLGFMAYLLVRLRPQGLQPPTEQVLVATAHQTLGALILMTAVLLAVRAFRHAPSGGTARA